MVLARAVMKLTRFGTAEAEHRMWEADRFGRSFLFTTHLELAELYVERFADHGLSVSMEPA